MSINRTYHTWFDRIRQLRPRERKTRVRNMAWLTAGIFESRSVHLSKITRRIPSTAMTVSITRRLSNFLKNKAVRVRDWYEPIAKDLLVNQAGSTTLNRGDLKRMGSSCILDGSDTKSRSASDEPTRCILPQY